MLSEPERVRSVDDGDAGAAERGDVRAVPRCVCVGTGRMVRSDDPMSEHTLETALNEAIDWRAKHLATINELDGIIAGQEQAIRERDERIAAQQNVLVRVGIGIGALDETQEHYGLKRIWREELQPLLAEMEGDPMSEYTPPVRVVTTQAHMDAYANREQEYERAIRERDERIVRLQTELEHTVAIAESWIHDELDGTSQLDAALANLDAARALLAETPDEVEAAVRDIAAQHGMNVAVRHGVVDHDAPGHIRWDDEE